MFLRQYAAVPLFVAFTLVWTQRYRQAFEQVAQLSQGLKQQVDAQRAEIERNVGQLVEAERSRVLSGERERLVSDLHDGLGLHLLTALKMARDPSAGREALAEVLADCLDDLRLAIDSMSNIDERDPVLLLASLRFRLAPRLQAAGVQLDWQVEGEVAPQPWMDAPRALHLLRVVQEALANAVRHAGATRVLLKVQAQGAGVAVAVIDDGRGIDAAAGPAGHGLASMRRRAALLGATLSVGPAPGQGTEVRLVLAA
jgi:signal transduction histidine kinase